MDLTPLLTVIVTLLVMEPAVTLFHKYVMHGPGWGWHRSHHEPGNAVWQTNDAYAVVFIAATIGLFIMFERGSVGWWVAVGITLYGVLYGLLHDVLIHRRFGKRWKVRHPYIQRLMTAHRLHHAVLTRQGAVSFGFLYAAQPEQLRQQLKTRRNP